jgi:heme A synthase
LGTHHRVGSIFWLVIGIYVAISAYRLGLGNFRQPGPGFIFSLMALLLIILSVIDLGTTFIGKSKGEKEKPEAPLWKGVRWQKVLIVLVGISIYNYLFNFLGFLLSTFLLMIFLFKAVEPTRWWVSILASLITILLSYGIFNLWLKVPFPIGVLGF